jgi:Tfp pilus assembly protein PilX
MKSRDPFRPRRGQSGISLLVVLIALVIIGFAAIALLRSSDTGTLVVGNLGFQKAALAAGDAGTEAAVTWLNDNAVGVALFEDDEAVGYYATTADNCDLTGTRTPESDDDDVDWLGADPGGDCNMQALDAGAVGDGYTVRYVINRVCNAEGDPNALTAADGVTPMACSRVGTGASEGSTRGGASYGNLPLSGETQTYYRITTRIDGPRNTTRYVQALVVL